MMKFMDIAWLAAKNIFTRGSNYYRVYRAILILGLPYLVADFDQNLEEFLSLPYTPENTKKLIEALARPVPWSHLAFEYLFPLLILLIISWLWEMFLCINPKNVKAIKLEFVERIYLRAFVLLFVWYVYFLDYVPYAHGPDFYPILFLFACLVVLIAGMSLTLRAARDRTTIFWVYLVATLLTTSYLAIPSLAESCRPSVIVIDSSMPHRPRLNALEEIWKYCF